MQNKVSHKKQSVLARGIKVVVGLVLFVGAVIHLVDSSLDFVAVVIITLLAVYAGGMASSDRHFRRGWENREKMYRDSSDSV